jgi:Fe-S-cluster containining protein
MARNGQLFRKSALVVDNKIHELGVTYKSLVEVHGTEEPIKCDLGCAFCCHQWVRVGAPEVLAMSAFIKENWSQESIETLLVNCYEYRIAFAAMPIGTHTPLRCPLLGTDNRCAAYGVRPLVCRGCNSTNADSCRRAYFEPEPDLTLPVVVPILEAANSVRRGIFQGLVDVRLSAESLVFALALETALTVPDAGERFFAGESVFAADAAPSP